MLNALESDLATLTAGQEEAFRLAQSLVGNTTFVVVQGRPGTGKTTVLQRLQRTLHCPCLDSTIVLAALSQRHPHALDEACMAMLEEAFRNAEVVLFDDLDLLLKVTYMTQAYPRPYLLIALLRIFYDHLRATSKTLVMSSRHDSALLYDHAVQVRLKEYSLPDYQVLFSAFLGEDVAKALDVNRLYSSSSRLHGHQIKAICDLVEAKGILRPATEDIIDCLHRHILSSNVEVSEVAQVGFEKLFGAGELLEQLDRCVLLPMREPEMAQRVGLKPTRGVLLHGEPGTGKTSIGRALAHRMHGQFFMIDGSFITEPAGPFFAQVQTIFDSAKANSPAVIFIDDADVLFQTDHVHGLKRLLLSALDGIESETLSQVCVMMTAMNVSDIPAAILRSGRIELWLETKLPDDATRIEILQHYASVLPDHLLPRDWELLAQATERFTPADLRRIVSDAKGLFAYDEAKGRQVKTYDAYLHEAAERLRILKGKVNSALRSGNGAA